MIDETLIDVVGMMFRVKSHLSDSDEHMTFVQFYEKIRERGLHFLPWDDSERPILSKEIGNIEI